MGVDCTFKIEFVYLFVCLFKEIFVELILLVIISIANILSYIRNPSVPKPLTVIVLLSFNKRSFFKYW